MNTKKEPTTAHKTMIGSPRKKKKGNHGPAVTAYGLVFTDHIP